MLMGSLLAGMAFNVTRLGLAHSAAMPLGSWENKLPHGLANAIMLPRVTEFNLMADYERFAEVAKALGEDIEGLPPREAAFLAVKALDDLVADIGIPARLGDAGIKRENIPAIAEETMKSRNTLVNPRQATLQEVIELLERSM
jgi:alcohol dehydrogenase